MIPEEYEQEIRVRYVKEGIDYNTLREHIMNWAQVKAKGPTRMHLGALPAEEPRDDDDVDDDEEPIPDWVLNTLSDEALDYLRKKGFGKGGKKGKGRDKGAKGNGKGDDNAKIQGNCHNCGKAGHKAVACRSAKKEGGAAKGARRGAHNLEEGEQPQGDE